MEFEQVYKVHQMLKASRLPIPMKKFQEALGEVADKERVSRDTVQRIFTKLRNTYSAPLVHKKGECPGWFYTKDSYELPGLWFSYDQLAGLLLMEQALEQMQAGFLADYLASFRIAIKTLLGKTSGDIEVTGCIKLLNLGQRRGQYKYFPLVAQALLNKQKLWIKYYTRSRDELGDRTVSPQRLILYKDNWYLDAYCDEKKALRQFAVDCIKGAEIKEEPIKVLDKNELDRFMQETYGIFYQPLNDWAVLKFSSYQARWIKGEIWHPDQKTRVLEDGSYELEIPFGDKTELIQSILKYGKEVEIMSPESLRKEIIRILKETLAQYKDG
jgi:predicted DNA-binding transcriptional regulator YafY